ncbi:S1C family serine protease [Ammoniphilus resinae]|uniref:S1-C subfamily serine protease n=1 Tax=Ammoniphilus resinae TaxID=861532 RepID=A0ABS4GMC4_9BACL|nr:serine protease [Ammoniphilus resinae]MBP1931421.1 S1-C subfamily serine protease [Ammoniphilus resinae]
MTDERKEEEYSEPDWDLVDQEEHEWEEMRVKRSRWKKRITRGVTVLVVIALFLNILTFWPAMIQWNAVEFLRTSYHLYQNEEISKKKQAVVSVVGLDRKGTGFTIDSTGIVVTNYHVIENAEGLYLHFADGSTQIPKVQTAIPELDLAVLKVDGEGFATLTPNYDYSWKKGEKVYFIGNPLGFPLIANEGEILGMVDVQGIAKPVLMIKTPIYKGNSGSPVFNQAGEVIAVVFATVEQPGQEGIVGLAVPIKYLKEDSLL